MITLISLIFVIIGGINWLLVGAFDFNLVTFLFHNNLYFIARIIYCLVGISALWLIIHLVYNQFSPKKLNAIECKNHKCQICNKDLSNE